MNLSVFFSAGQKTIRAERCKIALSCVVVRVREGNVFFLPVRRAGIFVQIPKFEADFVIKAWQDGAQEEDCW